MAPGIARRPHQARVALLIDAEKGVGLAGGLQGVDGNLHIAFGGVFEAHRHGEPAGHLAVDLTFAGARPNRCPGDQIGVVVSSNSAPAGRPMALMASKSWRARRNPVPMSSEPSRCGS